jgi:hypothetical protein
LNGQVIASFAHTFDNLVLPSKQTVSTGKIDDVLLVQGALVALGIVPQGKLDTSFAATAQVGQGGYTIPFLKLEQKGVPTTYDLGGLQLPQFKRNIGMYRQERIL